MTEIEVELLEIIKALTVKIEALEKAVYNDDNILMKSGFVVVDSPSPIMDNIGSSVANMTNMEWSDIHKLVENAGGQ